MKETEARIIYLDEIDDNAGSIGYKAVALAYDVQTGEARGIDETEAPAELINIVPGTIFHPSFRRRFTCSIQYWRESDAIRCCSFITSTIP